MDELSLHSSWMNSRCPPANELSLPLSSHCSLHVSPAGDVRAALALRAPSCCSRLALARVHSACSAATFRTASALHPLCIRIASALHPHCIRSASALHPHGIRSASAPHPPLTSTLMSVAKICCAHSTDFVSSSTQHGLRFVQHTARTSSFRPAHSTDEARSAIARSEFTVMHASRGLPRSPWPKPRSLKDLY